MDDKIDEIRNEFIHHMNDTICPFEAWQGKQARGALKMEYLEWLLNLADWSSFITLTFRQDVSYEVALSKWRLLVRYLNRDVFGAHYTKKVQHSYFSYVLATEYQNRGVLHFHALIDRPVSYMGIHHYWSRMAGFAYTQKVIVPIKALSYLLKYVLKEQDVLIYQAKALYNPRLPEAWWKE